MALAVAQATGARFVGTVSFGSSTTTGSLIASIGHTFGVSSYANGDGTDNKSNTFTLEPTSSNPGSGPGVGFWYNNAGTRGASHSMTVASASGIGIIEFTGQDTSTPIDSTTAAKASDGTSAFTVTSAAAISGTQAAVYGVTLDAPSGNTPWTPPTGYTEIFSEPDSANLVSESAYKNPETGTPSPAAAWTGGVSSGHELFVTVKQAASSFDPPLSVPPAQFNVHRM